MRETELAQKFTDYLSCYDLYFEVNAGGGCVDIVAVTPTGLTIAYEVKTSLNFKVIEQAIHNKPFFNMSYIAVPYSRLLWIQEQICRDYGIGLVRYNPRGYKHQIEEAIKPALNRKAMTKYLRLHEYQKRSIPGTASNGERITPFKITVENIEEYVRRHPGCSMKEMIANIDHHYHRDSGAMTSIYKWINAGVIKGVSLIDRKLFLKSAGEQK